jgi:hypothetical protein
MVGRSILALPRFVPVARPLNSTKLFVSEYWRFSGVFSLADAILSGFGETLAPSADTVSVYGAATASDVRRPSTTISHTPGVGDWAVRLVGLCPPWYRRNRTWPAPGVVPPPCRSTFSAGVPAGTRTK